MGRDHITIWGCASHHHSSPRHAIGMMRDNTIIGNTTTRNRPTNSWACTWKGAGEVTPKGLYFRKGRVDERSESYPVWMKPTRPPTPLGVVLLFFCAIAYATRTPFGTHTPNKNHMKILHIQNFILPLHPQLGKT